MTRSHLILSFVVAALGPGCAPSDPIDRGAFEASETTEATSLARVDNGDGTWSYALPSGFDPSVQVRGAIVTWRYAGQARHAYEPKMGGTRRYVVGAKPARTEDEKLGQMSRIDRLGRIWQASAVDKAKLAVAAAPHPAEVRARERALQRTAPPCELEPDLAPGTVVDLTPTSWTHRDCAPGGGVFLGNEVHLWDGDSRNAINSGHNNRQKTAVRVTVDGRTVCSGVLVRVQFVLTAAHCVFDDNRNPIDATRITACRDDINECAAFTHEVDFPSNYNPNDLDLDPDDDWALIHVNGGWPTPYSGPWSVQAQTMQLSSHDNDTLRALDRVFNLAFPQFAPGCTSSPNVLFQNTEFEPIANVSGDTLTLKIDGSPGHSGSPLYFCPEGDNDECDVGDQGFVIGVFSSWNSISDRYVAPKVAAFRSAAIAFITDPVNGPL